VKTVISNSTLETIELGSRFAEGLTDNDIVSVYGELGAGKTQFIKGICSRLGVKQVVNSPTFIIVNEYSSDKIGKIFHFDLYRIRSLDELYDIGFKDYIGIGGLILIEWPELVEPVLPDRTKKIRIFHMGENENMREIKFNGTNN
jgi:tRNA threonylcarbamoyladenosine biosynthesis protein TsaE